MKLMDIVDSKDVWQLLNFVATVGMMIATFLLFLVALPQARSAKDSAGAAQEALRLAEKNYTLAKESYESSSKENKERFELDKTNAQAQIEEMKWQVEAMKDQVKTMKEQFEIENTPYLSITNITKVVFSPNKNFEMDFTVTNLGINPVQTVERLTMFMIGSNEFPSIFKFFDEHLPNEKPKSGVFFISNKFNALIPEKFDNIISLENYDYVMQGKGTIYWATEITYLNLVNKKKRKFISICKLSSIYPPFLVVLKNDNISLSN